ncbi:hypothetical protein PsYK624_164430 [Phanerochaete sordida]|uniref:Uncharacterized protein n=1 Tax=Phanerochaete sordida TaxID=48140 RepID=A0A9P3GSA3_9APHY|nr:hypothetical protein PsYK624_164430 [Phanerochaete sordida]
MADPQDAAVWQTVGHDLIQTIVAVTAETFVVAIYSVLVVKTGRLLLRSSRTKVSLYTCAAVFVMFILDVALWIIDVRNLITEVRMTLLSTPTDTLSDNYDAALSNMLRLVSVEDIVYAYMTIVGDGVIIWRVYAFWSNGRERLVLFVPLAFLLGSFTTAFMITYCGSRLGADIVIGTFQHPAFCRNIQTASYSMTLATTAVATALIAFKTWQYRRTYLSAFGSSGPKSRTQRVMLMLIESGILYMLFFIVQVVTSVGSVNARIELNVRSTFAFTIYQYISSSIVGLYPTIVVLLVHSKHSILKSQAETSRTAVVFKQGRGAGESRTAYSTANTATFTSSPVHVMTDDADVYEMASAKHAGSGESEEHLEKGLRVQIQRSAPYVD